MKRQLFLSAIILSMAFQLSGSPVLLPSIDSIVVPSNQKIAIYLDLNVGQIIPHTSRFLPEITERTYLVDLGISKRLTPQGVKTTFGYPYAGIALHYGMMGNRTVFGRAIGLFPFAGFTGNITDRISFAWQLGGGVVHISETFDFLLNPMNNAIGSSINNITQGKLEARWKFSENGQISLGAALTHYSNGKARSPNLGVNIGSINAGFSHSIIDRPDENTMHNSEKNDSKKHGAFFRSGIGVLDRGVGTPQNAVFTQTAAYTYATSSLNNIWIGGTYAFDRAEYQTLLFIDQHGSNLPGHYASDWSLFIGNEMMFGNVGLWIMAGYYLYDPSYNVSPIYFKVGIQYYPFKFFGDHRIFFYSNIKSHASVADYFEFGIGYRI